MTIATTDELWARRFEPIPGSNHSRWVPISELESEMTPELREWHDEAMRVVIVHQSRRTVTVATKKYRARKKRR